MSPGHTLFARLDRFSARIENALLVTILASMIFLAAAQIFARNLFGTGILFGDELLRLMVLWLTLAGAVAASRMDRHISITVLDRFIPERAMRGVHSVTALFTAAVCAVIAWYSYRFVMDTRTYGDTLLNNTPAWILQAPLPVGFAVMAWRHLLHALRHARAFLRPRRT